MRHCWPLCWGAMPSYRRARVASLTHSRTHILPFPSVMLMYPLPRHRRIRTSLILPRQRTPMTSWLRFGVRPLCSSRSGAAGRCRLFWGKRSLAVTPALARHRQTWVQGKGSTPGLRFGFQRATATSTCRWLITLSTSAAVTTDTRITPHTSQGIPLRSPLNARENAKL